MVRVRFTRGQWGAEAQWAYWVRPSDRGKVRAHIEAHLSHRIHRAGENVDRVVGRCYRTPTGIYLIGHSGPRWVEYDVLSQGSTGVFSVRLVNLAPSPLPDPPIADPAGADSDQGVESPPSQESSTF